MTREELERRMDELARQYAHDELVKAELYIASYVIAHNWRNG